MQKLVTINTHTNTFEDNGFIEREYPLLTEYLEDGFKISQIIPYSTAADGSYRYTMIIVLEKN